MTERRLKPTEINRQTRDWFNLTSPLIGSERPLAVIGWLTASPPAIPSVVTAQTKDVLPVLRYHGVSRIVIAENILRPAAALHDRRVIAVSTLATRDLKTAHLKLTGVLFDATEIRLARADGTYEPVPNTLELAPGGALR